MKTKICPKCKEEKDLDSFNWKNKEQSRKQTHCKICQSNYTKEHYRNNKLPYILRAKAKKKKIRQFIYDYLKSHSCIDCGENSPIVLDFDHRDRNKKSFGICGAGLINGFSKIKEEIEKCDVRCANCHRKKTAKEDNWYKDLDR